MTTVSPTQTRWICMCSHSVMFHSSQQQSQSVLHIHAVRLCHPADFTPHASAGLTEIPWVTCHWNVPKAGGKEKIHSQLRSLKMCLFMTSFWRHCPDSRLVLARLFGSAEGRMIHITSVSARRCLGGVKHRRQTNQQCKIKTVSP